MEIFSRKNTIIILAAILVAIFSFFLITQSRKVQVPTKIEPSIEKLQKQSTSDEVQDIEKDLNQTDLSGIDAEIPDIENELNQSLQL